jgi:hypothetical protein
MRKRWDGTGEPVLVGTRPTCRDVRFPQGVWTTWSAGAATRPQVWKPGCDVSPGSRGAVPVRLGARARDGHVARDSVPGLTLGGAVT